MSVLMPVYNRELYVREAADSVLAQTLADLELIVIDDGSTDGTGRRLAEIDDPRVRRLRQEHRGIGAALNAGLRIARGRYVARLDSDDVWHPDLLATQVAVLEVRPELGAVSARARGIAHDGSRAAGMWGVPPRYPNDSLRSLVHGDFTCNITVVARRACFDRVGGYDESLRTSEDWDLWLRVARHFEVGFTDRVLARFRRHEGNVSGGIEDGIADRLRVLDKLFAQPGLPPAIAAMKPVAYANVHTGVGLLWLGAREYRRAARSFSRALAVSGRPVSRTARIAGLAVSWFLLGRFGWGRRVAGWPGALRRWWAPGSAQMRRA